MAFPKIIYGASTLTFLRQPRRVPAYMMEATRHDNVASSGVRESILERIDNFLELDMEWVGIGSDVTNWQAFFAYALQGGQFAYYPDAALSGHTDYLLEDTTWTAAYKVPGQYTFKLRFRQAVAWP